MEDELQVEQDEDGRWVAESRLLPGCATWGYTREEAIDTLREALQAFIDLRAHVTVLRYGQVPARV